MNNNSKNNDLNILLSKLNPLMIKDPLFMLFCPQKQKRADFINKYFIYYLEKWQKGGELLYSSSKCTAVSLINPDNYTYKFSGAHSLALKYNKNSFHILMHREIVEGIVSVVVPERMEKRIMNIYGSPDENLNEIMELTEECMKQAKENHFVLVYETLSKKLVPEFEKLGFEIGYARQFMNTQFFQTVMTYNVDSSN